MFVNRVIIVISIVSKAPCFWCAKWSSWGLFSGKGERDSYASYLSLIGNTVASDDSLYEGKTSSVCDGKFNAMEDLKSGA